MPTTPTSFTTLAPEGVAASTMKTPAAPRAAKTWVNYWKSDHRDMVVVDTSKTFVERKMEFYKRQRAHLEPMNITIHDMRGREGDFLLDEHGFQLVKSPVQAEDFAGDEVKNVYYAKVEALMKRVTGAYKVFIFDHHVRNMSVEASLTTPTAEDTPDIPAPARFVHIDNTRDDARKTVRDFLPAEADELLQKPFSLVNVWRPLRTVRKDPLGVVDARSLKEWERSERSLPMPEGDDCKMYHVRASPEHRWWFARNQEPNEFLLFKIYDSRSEDSFHGTAHSSFIDPETEHLGEDRESIEIRCLCFFEASGS